MIPTDEIIKANNKAQKAEDIKGKIKSFKPSLRTKNLIIVASLIIAMGAYFFAKAPDNIILAILGGLFGLANPHDEDSPYK